MTYRSNCAEQIQTVAYQYGASCLIPERSKHSALYDAVGEDGHWWDFHYHRHIVAVLEGREVT